MPRLHCMIAAGLVNRRAVFPWSVFGRHYLSRGLASMRCAHAAFRELFCHEKCDVAQCLARQCLAC